LTYLGLKPEGTCDVDKAAITSIKKALAQQPEHRNFCPRCDLLFQLRQLREENKQLLEDKQSVDAVDTLTEEGWIWDGDQWQRPPKPNQFKPDYNTEAMLTRQTARIVDLQTHIQNLEGEE